jgi:exodeoxyribonuclease VII large subunit
VQPTTAIPLSAFLGVVEDTVIEVFGDRKFWIIAETADVKVYRDRFYAFLNLIEKDGNEVVASAGAAIWRTNFGKIAQFEKITGVKFENNLKLVIQLSVSFNPKYGFRLVIHDIDTSYTVGQLSLQRELILNTLVEKHPTYVWKLDNRFVSANQHIQRRIVYNKIALIAAPGSDGYRDFVHELENNPWNIQFHVTLFPVPVQGDHAMNAMVNAIHQANKSSNFHAIVLVRGGGSQTDFSPYDSLELALAVASSVHPIFTGIGHERNISIVDELAFAQLKTPTKCAAYLIELNYEWVNELLHAKNNLVQLARKMITEKQQHTLVMRSQFIKSVQYLLASQKQKVIHQNQQIGMLLPINTVLRGYSLLRKQGVIVESIHEFLVGDPIDIQLKDGQLQATIINKKSSE